jgi:glycerophosphoryl diester phosphodiesterase
MALTPDAGTLLPLLERPRVGGAAQTFLMHAFDIAARAYTGQHYTYLLNPRGTAIGDCILLGERHGLVIERDDTQGDVNGVNGVAAA